MYGSTVPDLEHVCGIYDKKYNYTQKKQYIHIKFMKSKLFITLQYRISTLNISNFKSNSLSFDMNSIDSKVTYHFWVKYTILQHIFDINTYVFFVVHVLDRNIFKIYVKYKKNIRKSELFEINF